MSKKQVLIGGKWTSPPPNMDIMDWLNEPVALKICFETLAVTGYTLRWQTITAIRDSPHEKPQKVKIEL